MFLSIKTYPDPRVRSRPFDQDRDGYVPSEGYGILILEELEHAKKMAFRSMLKPLDMVSLVMVIVRQRLIQSVVVRLEPWNW
jgi:hypothetical protein